jgi:hypothetical protein
MSQRESRPTVEAAHEIPAKASSDSLAAGTDFTAEDRHAAFIAGYEQGKAERFDLEVEHQVQARLHYRALEALGMAKRHAAAKGPAWSALITECSQVDD